jgi:hypothetical protein
MVAILQLVAQVLDDLLATPTIRLMPLLPAAANGPTSPLVAAPC